MANENEDLYRKSSALVRAENIIDRQVSGGALLASHHRCWDSGTKKGGKHLAAPPRFMRLATMLAVDDLS